MKRELRERLEQVGWDALYEQHLSDLSHPGPQGERSAVSPFPGSLDTQPSFFVNPGKGGVWFDYHLGFGGDYVAFRALLEGRASRDEHGRQLELGSDDLAYQEVQRDLLVEFGVCSYPAVEYVGRCVEELARDPRLQVELLRRKPWTLGTLAQFNVGYDGARQRVVLPVYDRRGRLTNCRLYGPGATPKFFWLVDGLTDNTLFPHLAYDEPWLVLCEGEPDALTWRSFGFPGASGCGGAGAPVPPGNWWHGKQVWVCTDADAAGEAATRVAVERLRHGVTGLWVVRLPSWPGRPSNADVSDYVQHLLREGADRHAVASQLSELLRSAEAVDLPSSVYQRAATYREFEAALTAHNLRQHVAWRARVGACSERVYLAPSEVRLTCPTEGHPYCRRCPMSLAYAGQFDLRLEHRSADLLRLVQASALDQLDVYKRLVGVPGQCPDVSAEVRAASDVTPVVLYPSLDLHASGPGLVGPLQRREAYVVLNGHRLVENTEYAFEGFVHPAPRTQHAVFVVDRYDRVQGGLDSFQLTDDLRDRLAVFRPAVGQTVLAKLEDVADDLSDAVTRIRGRRDLHLAYRSVWHSVLALQFDGATLQRGWLEALIVGDTRCGKSQTFHQLAQFYGVGTFVDCKNQSTAGVLGSVVTSPVTGERYVAPGLLPQNDNGVVCFDEFHAQRWGGRGVLEALSATRSEGVVHVAKAASASFRARVRTLWLGNPGQGRLVKDLGGEGVELVHRLVGQPEDVARFDLAVLVAQGEVSDAEVNALRPPTEARYPTDLSRALLWWAYSRTPEQVYLTPEAEALTVHVVRLLLERYDPSVPLVEPADQRHRVAKLAASVAVQCFSADAEDRVRVEPQHVEAAYQLLCGWYDKPSFGYDAYSERRRLTDGVADLTTLRALFDEQLAPHGRALAIALLELDQFTDRTFLTLVAHAPYARTLLQQLHHLRCVRSVDRGRSEAYEATPAFVAWLRDYSGGGV